MSKPAIARQVAFEILERVALGGYASELLIERTVALESRDAGLAAEITLGVLRRQGQLDFLIEHYSGRPMAKLDAAVAIALRMAVYQIRFLDRVPAYAAVNDSLNLIRGARKVSSVGFANAVLRKIGARDLAIPPGREAPVWLLEKWTRDFGAETAHSIAEASLAVPLLYQRVPAGEEPPVGARPTSVPGCYEVDTPDPRYRVQDIGSQAIVPLLEPLPLGSFLDLCSAPGNKTAQMTKQSQFVYACDLSFQRLRGVEHGFRVVLDAAAALPFRRKFERILVDAPCSGTGTLGHNPEIKWRLEPGDLPRFAERQRRILTRALEALAPEGVLVYSTCSLEPEENEEVVRAVAGARMVREMRRMPGRNPGDGFYAAVIR